jgi:hypothetical protein
MRVTALRLPRDAGKPSQCKHNERYNKTRERDDTKYRPAGSWPSPQKHCASEFDVAAAHPASAKHPGSRDESDPTNKRVPSDINP